MVSQIISQYSLEIASHVERMVEYAQNVIASYVFKGISNTNPPTSTTRLDRRLCASPASSLKEHVLLRSRAE